MSQSKIPKNKQFDQVLEAYKLMGSAMRYLAHGRKGLEDNKATNSITRVAIARLAYNSAMQYVKLSLGVMPKGWDDRTDITHWRYAEEVLRIEAGITGRADHEVATAMERTAQQIDEDLFPLNDGCLGVFRAVASAAICDQLGVAKPVDHARNRACTRADVIVGLEDLVLKATMDFATPATIAVSPEAWQLLKQPDPGTERIVLAGSPQGADKVEMVSVVIHGQVHGEVRTHEDKSLGYICAVMKVKDAKDAGADHCDPDQVKRTYCWSWS